MKKVSINYKDFAKDVKKGESVLIDDGKIILEVLKTDRTESRTKSDSRWVIEL